MTHGEMGMTEGHFSFDRSLRLGVDLTPVLPGGENGGARVWVLELVRALARKRPDWHFQLLTCSLNHEFLSPLDRPNVSRALTDQGPVPKREKEVNWPHLRRLWGVLPRSPRVRLKKILNAPFRHQPLHPSRKWDLLFCPFTAPFFWEPSTPCVCLVHDLQYRDYPEFFSRQDRASRDTHFREACDRSARLVVASNFVRDSVIRAGGIDPEKVLRIPIRRDQRSRQNGNGAERVRRFGVSPGSYLIYPANLWPHKNHRMLLTAFGIFQARNPGNQIHLVLTGNTLERGEALREELLALGLGSKVSLTGYVSDGDLINLLQNALAMVFPSLYEGFGIPLLEAMSLAVPVLAGNRTAIPETCDGAALLVDPRGPFDWAAAIARVVSDGELRARLSEAGRIRVERLGGAASMISEFESLFLELAARAN